MDTIRFFHKWAILLVLALFTTGTLLLHDSARDSGTRQPWDLLGGAVLCSLGAFTVYLLFRPTEHE